MSHEKQKTILSFWFGDDPLHPLEKKALWFAQDPSIDSLIRDRFEDMLTDAATGAFDDWAKTQNGSLAFVILCDQLPRNMYRGETRAFAHDQRALRSAQIAIAHGFDRTMTPTERCFLYLPFEHSEDLGHQERSVELFRSLAESANGDERGFIAEALRFAVRHHSIISEYGRFPHRNEILGRSSTRREIEFLKRPGAYF